MVSPILSLSVIPGSMAPKWLLLHPVALPRPPEDSWGKVPDSGGGVSQICTGYFNITDLRTPCQTLGWSKGCSRAVEYSRAELFQFQPHSWTCSSCSSTLSLPHSAHSPSSPTSKVLSAGWPSIWHWGSLPTRAGPELVASPLWELQTCLMVGS